MQQKVAHKSRFLQHQFNTAQPSEIKKNEIKTNSRKKIIKPNFLHLLIITVLTFAAYFIALKNDYTNWDDKAYVINNPLIKPLNWSTVKEIFLSNDLDKRYWMGNYHPLTMLSLAVTYSIAPKDADGQPAAWAFILTNILLHIVNSILVYLFILALTQSRFMAFAAGLLFGVHTLHVESVAWIAERKDVLYSLFFIWALLVYVRYVDNGKWWRFALAFVLFVLSLFAKGQAVSLAVSIILIDILRQRKLLSFKVIAEKMIFLVVALIFGLIAIEAQKHSLALEEQIPYPLYKRVGIAAYGFGQYILKLFLPVRLAALYPYPDIINRTIPWYYYAFLIPDLLIVAFMIYLYVRKKLVPAFGIAFFIVNIFLLLQLIPVGSAIYADRYAYIPSIGFFLFVAYYLDKIRIKNVKHLLLGAYTLLLAVLTFNRCQVWRNSMTLWTDTLRKQPKSVIAWNNLGSEYAEMGQRAYESFNLDLAKYYYSEANKCFDTAIVLKPDYANAFYNYSSTLYKLYELTLDSSLLPRALEYVNKAIAIKIDMEDAFLQRGLLLDIFGQEDRALLDYQRVLELNPSNVRALLNIGTYYGKKGQYRKAIKYFDRVIAKNPSLSAAYSNKGLAYMHLNQLDSAIFYLKKALQLEPASYTAHYNLALAYIRTQQFADAIYYLKQAIKLSPNNPEFHYTLGNVFIETAQFDKACQQFRLAAALNYQPAKVALKRFCKNL